MNLPQKIYTQKIYTEKELTRAKSSSRIVGWAQGGGVVLGGVIILKLLGWIPIAVGLAGAGWLAYKMMSRPKGDDAE